MLAALLSVSSSVWWRGSTKEERDAADEAHRRLRVEGQGDAVTLYRLYKTYEQAAVRKEPARAQDDEQADELNEAYVAATPNARGAEQQQVALGVPADGAAADAGGDEEADAEATSVAPQEGEAREGEEEEEAEEGEDRDGSESVASEAPAHDPDFVAAQEEQREDRRARLRFDARAAKAWCKAHCVSYRALALASSTARDLLRAVKRLPELRAAVPQAQLQEGGALSNEHVRRLVAAGYFLNAAVLVSQQQQQQAQPQAQQHQQRGGGATHQLQYLLLRTDRTSFGVPHPSSALAAALRGGAQPGAAYQWVVFLSVLHTSRPFLLTCTPIDERWLAAECAEFAALVQQRRAAARTAQIEERDLSLALLRRLVGKGFSGVAALERRLDADAYVDHDARSLRLWCTEQRRAALQAQLRALIDGVRSAALRETHEELIAGATRVVYGAGAEVVHVLFGAEHISINVQHLRLDTDEARLRALCEPFGAVRFVEVQVPPSAAAAAKEGAFGRVVFERPESAAQALARLQGELSQDGALLVVTPGGVRPPGAVSTRSSRLVMTWATAPSQGYAFLLFASAAAANEALKTLRISDLNVTAVGVMPRKAQQQQQQQQQPQHKGEARPPLTAEGHFELPVPGSGGSAWRLRVGGLAPSVDEEELAADVRGRLARFGCNVPVIHVAVARKDAAASEEQLQVFVADMRMRLPLRERIESSTSFFAGRGRAGLAVFYAGGPDVVDAAMAQWRAERSAEQQRGQPAPEREGQRVRMRVEHSSALYVHPAVWVALQEPLEAEIAQAKARGVTVQRSMRQRDEAAEQQPNAAANARVSLNLSSADRAQLDASLAALQRVMRFVLYAPQQPQLAKWQMVLFSERGRQLMERLGPECGYVHWSNATREIRIYGLPAAQARCTEALDGIVLQLSPGCEQRTLYVADRRQRRTVAAQRVELLRSLALHELRLEDLRLVASGPIAALDRLQQRLGGLVRDTPPPSAQRRAAGDCCLCFDTMDARRYESSACAHASCLDCAQHMFASADAQQDARVPVACVMAACKVPMAWSDVVSLCTPAALAFVKATALRKYVREHPNELRPCPAPACNGVVRVPPLPADERAEAELGGRVASCDGCGSAYCLTCSERKATEAHQGSSCREMQDGNSTDVRQHAAVLNELLNLRCPRCKTVFLDFEGCFALTCGTCNAHFCAWCFHVSDGDVHPHVKACPRSRSPGSYYSTLASFNAVHVERRQMEATAYLNSIQNAEVRAKVIAFCKKSFDDLGIRLA